MIIASKILVATVAVLHLYILYIEMFAWETRGRETFKSIPANQGLYNGFLAAGLLWSIFVSDTYWSENISVFFLTCIIVAGIYGAYSVSRMIFIFQSVPAIIALIFVLIS